MRTHLIIANRTLGGPELLRVVAERVALGPARFHVVVPATRRPGLLDRVVDAYAGEPDDGDVRDALDAARGRLDDELARLRELGAEADGEVGVADPLLAAREAVRSGRYDEVILSTLPAGASQWLGRDLPRRLARSLGRPVTHVEGPAPA